MQRIKTEVLITIPDNMVLITKIEYEQLQENELSGMYWNMKELEKRINKKSEWIKDNILYPSRFRKILDSNNGGFVFYPQTKGQTWSFQATKMAKFLDENFKNIFSK